ncbi:MAG: hypothetical protein Q8Q13_02850 [bacterium]|nr:hypothetical protein [bacterium]
MDNFKKSALVVIFLLIPVLVLLYLGAFALTYIYDISYLELLKNPYFLVMIALSVIALVWSIRLIVTPVVVKPSDYQPIIKSKRGRNIGAFLTILFMFVIIYFISGGEATIQMIVKVVIQIAIVITPLLVLGYLIRLMSK